MELVDCLNLSQVWWKNCVERWSGPYFAAPGVLWHGARKLLKHRPWWWLQRWSCLKIRRVVSYIFVQCDWIFLQISSCWVILIYFSAGLCDRQWWLLGYFNPGQWEPGLQCGKLCLSITCQFAVQIFIIPDLGRNHVAVFPSQVTMLPDEGS